MNYRQLETFYAVMQTGSITAGARTLNLTQPAVTKILRHTEDQLGFLLFNRVKGRLIPTDDALALFPDVERVFDEMRTVRQTIDDIRSDRTGTLSIVAIPTLGEVLLPLAISEFLRERPDVSISFEVRPRRTVVQSVATQRADLGFAFLAREHANVVSSEMCRGQIVCIMREDHPLAHQPVVTPAILAGHSLVYFSKEQGLRTILDAIFADARIEIRPSLEVSWVSTAWSMVNQGIGVALVDDFSQLGALYANIVSRPFLPRVEIVAETLRPRTRPLSRLAAAFINVATSVLNEQMRQH